MSALDITVLSDPRGAGSRDGSHTGVWGDGEPTGGRFRVPEHAPHGDALESTPDGTRRGPPNPAISDCMLSVAWARRGR
eukprot:5827359-Prymnesium_polylepis.1